MEQSCMRAVGPGNIQSGSSKSSGSSINKEEFTMKQKITVTVLAFTGILLLSGVFIASSSARRAASAADQFAHVSAAGAHGGASATQLDNMVTLEMETTTSKQQHLRQGGSSHGSGSDNGADNGSGAGAGSDGARRTIPGGLSDVKEPNDAVIAAVNSLKGEILGALKENSAAQVEVVAFRSQVVAGTNYFVKVAIDSGNGAPHYATCRIFKPLPIGGEKPATLAACVGGQTKTSKIEYIQP